MGKVRRLLLLGCLCLLWLGGLSLLGLGGSLLWCLSLLGGGWLLGSGLLGSLLRCLGLLHLLGLGGLGLLGLLGCSLLHLAELERSGGTGSLSLLDGSGLDASLQSQFHVRVDHRVVGSNVVVGADVLQDGCSGASASALQ